MEVMVLAVVALGGYFVGFVAHHLSRCGQTPNLVVVSLPNGSSTNAAGVLLRKAAMEMKQRGWDGRLDLLSGLIFKGEGAVYTPETRGKTAIARFLRAANLLEDALLKKHGNQSPNGRDRLFAANPSPRTGKPACT